MFPSKWLKLKGMTIPRIGKNIKELELTFFAGRIVIWFNHFGKPVDNVYQRQTSCTHDQAIPTKIGDYIHQKICTKMDTAALFIIATD